MQELTVYIGRFNPFHLGHAGVLSRAFSRSRYVLVLIGSSGASRSVKNPFTYEEREDMVYNWAVSAKMPTDRLFIMPIRDYPYNDQKWIAEVQETVLNCARALDIDTTPYLTGAKKDESSWYLDTFGGFFNIDLIDEVIGNISATFVREEYLTGGSISGLSAAVPETTVEFLRHFRASTDFEVLFSEYRNLCKYRKSWENSPFPPVFVTVDAVVIQSGHVLVVTRKNSPGKGLWALPGGFLDSGERIQNAVVRELKEETDIEMSPAQLHGSITHKEVFDHPDRDPRGRTITHAFLFKLKDTFLLPKIRPQLEEVSKVEWVPIAQALASSEKWFGDHHAILTHMCGKV